MPDVTRPRRFPSAARWREWLEANHRTATELWLLLPKKHVPPPRLEYEDAICEALCFGWIDGIAKAHDADHSALRFTPRRPRGLWSFYNIDRVERMIAAGKMTPAGMAEVDQAKADGRWEAGARRRELTWPDAVTAALKRSARARAFLDALPRGKRRVALEWLDQARRPQTLASRCQALVEAAEQGRFVLDRPPPTRPKGPRR